MQGPYTVNLRSLPSSLLSSFGSSFIRFLLFLGFSSGSSSTVGIKHVFKCYIKVGVNSKCISVALRSCSMLISRRSLVLQ